MEFVFCLWRWFQSKRHKWRWRQTDKPWHAYKLVYFISEEEKNIKNSLDLINENLRSRYSLSFAHRAIAHNHRDTPNESNRVQTPWRFVSNVQGANERNENVKRSQHNGDDKIRNTQNWKWNGWKISICYTFTISLSSSVELSQFCFLSVVICPSLLESLRLSTTVTERVTFNNVGVMQVLSFVQFFLTNFSTSIFGQQKINIANQMECDRENNAVAK